MGRSYLDKKKLSIAEWLRFQSECSAPPDEFSIYLISRMLDMPMAIVTQSDVRYTSNEHDFDEIRLHFVYHQVDPDRLTLRMSPVLTTMQTVALHAEYRILRGPPVKIRRSRKRRAVKRLHAKRVPIPVKSGEDRVRQAQKRKAAKKVVKVARKRQSGGLSVKKVGLPKRPTRGRRFIVNCGCDIARFASRKLLDAHVRDVHKKTFGCVACNTICGSQVSLNRHVRVVHFRAGRHVCIVCGAKFVFKSYLAAHLVQHEQERTKYKLWLWM